MSAEVFVGKQTLDRGDRDPVVQCALRLARGRPLGVLIFHRVLREHDPLRPHEPTATEFAARMQWVAANFTVLTLTEAVEALKADRLPHAAICITFDDGYADNHDVALPILNELGIRATFFVATGYLDGGCMFNDAVVEAIRQHACGTEIDLTEFGLGRHVLGGVDDKLRAIGQILVRLKYEAPVRREQIARRLMEHCRVAAPTGLMMTSEQVAALHQAGMQIGAHTVNHPILATLDLVAARDEITRSKSRLEEITGSPVRLFAYPNGRPHTDYRREHVELAREIGFDAAVSTACGAARPGSDPMQIPRFTPWDRSNRKFGLRLARNLMRQRYASV